MFKGRILAAIFRGVIQFFLQFLTFVEGKCSTGGANSFIMQFHSVKGHIVARSGPELLSHPDFNWSGMSLVINKCVCNTQHTKRLN